MHHYHLHFKFTTTTTSSVSNHHPHLHFKSTINTHLHPFHNPKPPIFHGQPPPTWAGQGGPRVSHDPLGFEKEILFYFGFSKNLKSQNLNATFIMQPTLQLCLFLSHHLNKPLPLLPFTHRPSLHVFTV